MVLEAIYEIGFLKKNPAIAFLMGIAYSLIGITCALIMFPSDPALIAVAFTAILLLLEFNKLALLEETIAVKQKTFWKFIKPQGSFFKAYLYAFGGVFITFAGLSMLLPSLAANYLFQNQINILSGHATFTVGLFWDLMRNNITVLSLCFGLAFLAGAGGLFLIVWNASVWGTIFGTIAKSAALATGKNQIILFIIIIISVIPHMLLEISSYILAVMSGAMISEGFVHEKLKKHQNKILKYNIILMIIAILVLVVAMIIETYVLDNFTTYQNIIDLAFAV